MVSLFIASMNFKFSFLFNKRKYFSWTFKSASLFQFVKYFQIYSIVIDILFACYSQIILLVPRAIMKCIQNLSVWKEKHFKLHHSNKIRVHTSWFKVHFYFQRTSEMDKIQQSESTDCLIFHCFCYQDCN